MHTSIYTNVRIYKYLNTHTHTYTHSHTHMHADREASFVQSLLDLLDIHALDVLRGEKGPLSCPFVLIKTKFVIVVGVIVYTRSERQGQRTELP